VNIVTAESGWHRSQRCESGACVEAARIGDDYAIRDSQRPDLVLRFSGDAWRAFTTSIRSGDLDLR